MVRENCDPVESRTFVEKLKQQAPKAWQLLKREYGAKIRQALFSEWIARGLPEIWITDEQQNHKAEKRIWKQSQRRIGQLQWKKEGDLYTWLYGVVCSYLDLYSDIETQSFIYLLQEEDELAWQICRDSYRDSLIRDAIYRLDYLGLGAGAVEQAQDFFEETLTTVRSKIHSFTLRNRGGFYKWFRKTQEYRILNYWRMKKNEEYLSDNFDEYTPTNNLRPVEDEAEQNVFREIYQSTIFGYLEQYTSPTDQIIIIDYFIRLLKPRQIESDFIPISRVYQLVHKVKKQLRDDLSDYLPKEVVKRSK